MMAVYFIVQLNINDRSKYSEYRAGFMEIFPSSTGRVLAADDAPVVLEGEWDYTRTILTEFPSKAEAMEFYNSDAYQQLCEIRWASCESNFVLVDGLD
jgi:uncharacterized protein (DUF1330 family)